MNMTFNFTSNSLQLEHGTIEKQHKDIVLEYEKIY